MRITVRAPATIANFGPGFDVFGMCIDKLYDTVEVETTHSGLTEIFCKDSKWGKGILKNTAGRAAMAVRKRFIERYREHTHTLAKTDFKISIVKGYRVGSGLGSSAASAAGTAFAVHATLSQMTGQVLPLRELAECAAEGEGAAGGVHPDNSTAALFGGFTVAFAPQVKYGSSMEWAKAQHWKFRRALSHSFNRGFERFEPLSMYFSIIFPMFSLKTKFMRNVLEGLEPSGDDFSKNVGYVKGVVEGFRRHRPEIVFDNLEDRIVTPARKANIKYFDAMRTAAIDAGAKAFILCGSGPSVAAISGCRKNANNALDAMYSAYGEKGLLEPKDETCFITKPNQNGVEVLESDFEVKQRTGAELYESLRK